MPTTPWVPLIRTVTDGTDKVSAAIVNPIFRSYTDRTQHLYEKFQELENKSVLVAFDQLVVGTSVAQYSVVYYNHEAATPGLELARPGYATADYATQYKASKTAYTFGIIKSSVPASGDKIVDVYLQGLIEVEGIVTSLLDSSPDNEDYDGGPLYLSALEPGKLTYVPGGQAIFVGYAKNADEFYLNPSYESFNDFFFNFKYPILDRPAGTPSLTDTTWEIQDPDFDRVGWVPADHTSLTEPDGDTSKDKRPSIATYGEPSFFYNIPADDDTIDDDDGLTDLEKANAKALRKSLPPNPAHFSFYTVNGIIQDEREDTTTGIYRINEHGIWWYSDQEDSQPWAKDLYLGLPLTPADVDSGTGTFTLASHGFEDGDTISFFITDGSSQLPSGITSVGTYTITDATTDTFTLSGVTLTTSGVGTFYIEWKPEAWAIAKGTDYLRARMIVQFAKVNPDYKTAVVTSLQASDTATNNSTKTIQFVNPSGDASTTGDLTLQFDLNDVVTEEETATGIGVKSIDYNKVSGDLEITTGTVVSSVKGLGLAKVTTNDVTGQCTITVDNTNQSNLVTSLEVEQARLEYIGLHSHLTTDHSLLPAGFVGKFLLPSTLPSSALQFKIMLFGKSSLSELSASTKTRVKFQFQYVVTKPNVVLSSTVAETKTFYVDLGASYIKNTVTVFTPTEFVIPRTALVEGGIVNFRLHRVKVTGADAANYYDGSICINGTYWSLG